MKSIIIFIFCVLLAGTMKAQDWGDKSFNVQFFLWEDNGQPSGIGFEGKKESVWYAWEDGYQETYNFDEEGGLESIEIFEEMDSPMEEWTKVRDKDMLFYDVTENTDEYKYTYTHKEDKFTVYIDELKKNLITIIEKL